MQGTCLDNNGKPSSSRVSTQPWYPECKLYNHIIGLPEAVPGYCGRSNFFSNRFVAGKASNQTVFTNLCSVTDLKPFNPCTMNSVRTELEKGFADGDYTDTANGRKATTEERISFRRMMSCYWANASLFSLDLVGAVIRQGIFIEKMHRIDWIHSPAAKFTMQRLLIKYDPYLAIVAKFKARIAVPTFDVDFAWHTHQLCPPMYFRHTVTRLNKFLNYDDKIEETVLSESFDWTSKTYQKMYNELYSECTCWYCEAVRESHAPAFSGLNPRKKFGGKASVIDEQLNQLHLARDGSAEMNHVSAPSPSDRTLHLIVLSVNGT